MPEPKTFARSPLGFNLRLFASAAAELAMNATVQLIVRDIDRYGRMVAVVVLADGRSLNHELVRARFVWWKWKRATGIVAFGARQTVCRRGIWRKLDTQPSPSRIASARRSDPRSQRRPHRWCRNREHEGRARFPASSLQTGSVHSSRRNPYHLNSGQFHRGFPGAAMMSTGSVRFGHYKRTLPVGDQE